jgi:hypothetical protein
LSSIPDGGVGGGLCFGGMVSRKQRATKFGYWLVKKAQQPKVESHYPKHLTLLL